MFSYRSVKIEFELRMIEFSSVISQDFKISQRARTNQLNCENMYLVLALAKNLQLM